MISAPVDYGMNAAQTLAHRLDPVLPDGFAREFDAHWAAFREAVAALPLRWQGAIDSPINQVVIRSLGAVRIAARVSIPDALTQLRGVVVASHGYSEVPDVFSDEPEAWTSHGLATVRVRVRGFPPSTADIDDLRSGWIMHQPPYSIECASAWIVHGAVADIVQAVRCARQHFGEDTPIALHGESLGGGLAAMAAAQLAQMNQPPQRLILTLPTFGDWRWRATRYCNGSGGQINVLLDALRGEERERLLRGVMLFDAALHARSIASPTLALLAEVDDVVPAPTAAAIVNAIPDQSRVWRFIVRFGHFDGGLANARRHLLFEELQAAFADPTVPLPELMRKWTDRLTGDAPKASRRHARAGGHPGTATP